MRMPPCYLVIGALVVANVGWAYLLYDQAVAMDDVASEVARERGVSSILSRLLENYPQIATRDQAYSFLQARFPGEVVKQSGDRIEVGGVVLTYQGGELLRVEQL